MSEHERRRDGESSWDRLDAQRREKARAERDEPELTVGTEIYYTGDMANSDGFGRVAEYLPDSRFGDHWRLLLEDGREQTVTLASFQPAPGRRFWIAEEWRADWRRRNAENQEQMRKAAERRSERMAEQYAGAQGEARSVMVAIHGELDRHHSRVPCDAVGWEHVQQIRHAIDALRDVAAMIREGE